MLFFSAVTTDCVKGKETRKEPLALHYYKTFRVWSWRTLLIPFSPPTLVFYIPIAQNLLASLIADFKAYNTHGSFEYLRGPHPSLPTTSNQHPAKTSVPLKSLQLHRCGSPCGGTVRATQHSPGCQVTSTFVFPQPDWSFLSVKTPSYLHPDTFSTLALQQRHLKSSKNIQPPDGKLLCIWHWELSSALCDDLKGWGAGGRSRGRGCSDTYSWCTLLRGRNK